MKNRNDILVVLAKSRLLLEDYPPEPQPQLVAKRSFLLGWLSLAVLILGTAFMQAQVTTMSPVCAGYDVPNVWPLDGATFCVYGPQHTQFATGCNYTISQYNCQVAYVQAEGKPGHNHANDVQARTSCLNAAQTEFSLNEETLSEWNAQWKDGICSSTPNGVIYAPIDYPEYEPPATE